MGPSLHCFAEICRKIKLSRTPGPLSRLLKNPDFPPGFASHPLSSKQPDIGIRIHHLLQNGLLHSFDNINTL